MRIIPQLTMMIAYLNLTKQILKNYKDRNAIPFKGSPVQLYCKYLNEYHIKKQYDSYHRFNRKTLFEEELKHKDGWLQIDKGNVIALNGLDGYCLPKLVDPLNTLEKILLKSFLK
jgi:hypothetical protein